MYHRIATTVINMWKIGEKKVLKCCSKSEKMLQLVLKSQERAQECWKCKIVLQIRKSAQRNRDMPSVYAGRVVLPGNEA